MAESRMGEEEGHGNLKLEMTKEVRKNVNVTNITVGQLGPAREDFGW